MQAFVFNLRRDKFKDQRVRRAFNLAFDFEDINRTIFYGLYERISSYLPRPRARLLGPAGGTRAARSWRAVRDKVPASVFTTPYKNPVGGTPEAVRNNLREADRLLQEAGWELKDGRRVNAKGEP